MSHPTDPYGWEERAWEAAARERLPSTAVVVYVLLAKHANGQGEARPSARTIGGYFGRTEKPVRAAMALLERRGLIAAVGTYRRATVWHLTAAPASAVDGRVTADHGSAPGQGAQSSTADPESALTAERLRSDCGVTADPGSAKGEGEGEELLSLHTEARDAGESEVDIDWENVVSLRRLP
jgi:hypothetical protein